MRKDKGGGGERDRRGIRRKLALHGGLEYRPTPTGWLHHRHRLHLLRPTSCLPIHAAYPAPSGWRHAQDASGVKLPRASFSLFPLVSLSLTFSTLPLAISFCNSLHSIDRIIIIPVKCAISEIHATTSRTSPSRKVSLSSSGGRIHSENAIKNSLFRKHKR